MQPGQTQTPEQKTYHNLLYRWVSPKSAEAKRPEQQQVKRRENFQEFINDFLQQREKNPLLATLQKHISLLNNAGSEQTLEEIRTLELDAGGLTLDNPFVTHNSQTALMIAVQNQDHESVRILIAAKANVNFCDQNGETALTLAAANKDNLCLALLLEQKPDVNAAGKGKWTALMKAAYVGDVAAVTKLLAAKAQVNVSNNETSTALTLAIECGSLECVQALVQAGADVNHVKFGQNTCLLLAASKPNAAIFNCLIANSANVGNYRTYEVGWIIVPSPLSDFMKAELMPDWDWGKASPFYENAANQNYAPAFRRLGERAEKENNILKAAQYYVKALAGNDLLVVPHLERICNQYCKEAEQNLVIALPKIVKLAAQLQQSMDPVANQPATANHGNLESKENPKSIRLDFLEKLKPYLFKIKMEMALTLTTEEWNFLAHYFLENPQNFRNPLECATIALWAAKQGYQTIPISSKDTLAQKFETIKKLFIALSGAANNPQKEFTFSPENNADQKSSSLDTKEIPATKISSNPFEDFLALADETQIDHLLKDALRIISSASSEQVSEPEPTKAAPKQSFFEKIFSSSKNPAVVNGSDKTVAISLQNLPGKNSPNNIDAANKWAGKKLEDIPKNERKKALLGIFQIINPAKRFELFYYSSWMQIYNEVFTVQIFIPLLTPSLKCELINFLLDFFRTDPTSIIELLFKILPNDTDFCKNMTTIFFKNPPVNYTLNDYTSAFQLPKNAKEIKDDRYQGVLEILFFSLKAPHFLNFPWHDFFNKIPLSPRENFAKNTLAKVEKFFLEANQPIVNGVAEFLTGGALDEKAADPIVTQKCSREAALVLSQTFMAEWFSSPIGFKAGISETTLPAATSTTTVISQIPLTKTLTMQ